MQVQFLSTSLIDVRKEEKELKRDNCQAHEEIMKIINKNILDVTEGVIVQQVNCQGVMGSGLAKQIRDKYSQVYESYKKYQFKLGQIQLVKITERLYVCNLAGQEFYGRDGKQYTNYSAVETGLNKLFAWTEKPANIHQIYIPFNMGCGLGGGDWSVIEATIHYLEICYCKIINICKLGDN